LDWIEREREGEGEEEEEEEGEINRGWRVLRWMFLCALMRQNDMVLLFCIFACACDFCFQLVMFIDRMKRYVCLQNEGSWIVVFEYVFFLIADLMSSLDFVQTKCLATIRRRVTTRRNTT